MSKENAEAPPVYYVVGGSNNKMVVRTTSAYLSKVESIYHKCKVANISDDGFGIYVTFKCPWEPLYEQ